ncbi:beta-propeller domain-containing protein [Oceanirhabdus sp. W0125-5]|uniref:beta-propeller domain-containing protein n=1 Tax=Oceanirhabdus sp. W0125-5 TaxID=2999116 RepID=UPI0022F2E13B|nr:beta-propeller domain-containing protein [Oceanirhabdus sp. W0125-5]WBW98678.1 beta-propeller domain-containing protein [Oceanirhabdus sp. W0125-5]
MTRFNKYLFLILFLSIFYVNKTTYAADLNQGTSFQLNNIENFDNIIHSMDNSENSISWSAIITNSYFNDYVKYGDNHIFRVKDNTIELLELSAANSKLLTQIKLDNFNIHDLYIRDNYLIVLGDQLKELNTSSSPFITTDSITSIKIFNIDILESPSLVKEFSLSGNLMHIKFSGDLMMIFSKHTPYKETYLDLSFLPYYSIDGEQTFYNINNIYSLPSEVDEKNYLCGITVSLKDDITLCDAKTIWGVGDSIYSDDNFIYLTSSNNNKTQVYKLSIDEKLFLDNYSIEVPGNITFYDALNIENNSLKLITTLKNNDQSSFAMYLLDDTLNILDTYFVNKYAVIDRFYFLDNNLFVKYYSSLDGCKGEYASFSFDNSEISVRDATNIITGDMYYTHDYIFALNIIPGESTLFTMNIYDWDYNLISKANLSTKDAYGIKGLMYYDEENKVLALPMTLKSKDYKEHLLIYKQNDKGDFDVNLITTFNDEKDSDNGNYIDQISEFITLQGDFLYTISPDFINVYDLKNNTLVTRKPL